MTMTTIKKAGWYQRSGNTLTIVKYAPLRTFTSQYLYYKEGEDVSDLKLIDELPFTWRDVKEIVDGLPNEMLNETVTWWGDGRGGKVDFIRILGEDFYSYGEYEKPESNFANESEKEGWMLSFKKGTPIISLDN